MGAQLGVVSGQVAVGSAAPERRRDRWFFTGMAVASLLAVVIGFGPTYYLKARSERPRSRPSFTSTASCSRRGSCSSSPRPR